MIYNILKTQINYVKSVISNVFDISTEDLMEWAKEDVRSQLRVAMKDSLNEEFYNER
ncbi:hypothetical protein [Aquimarina muelleri]|uniref:Uncharacterized protein n=1 Tax=Aquimarina muelleri TaxID=279356 RepID=A0A918N4B8_9FLAO|nr:hypothetical protein [Aquimarina muelleri]MCX2765058.1 hypothetical protein [Aquimarina muelleri]GGX19091.1 hypothetical protein GCM10007384_20540 [Aquimarina muelleri]